MRRTKRGGWPYSQPPNVQFKLNRASPQADGLVSWWPALASRGAQLRELLKYGLETTEWGNGFTWITDPEMGAVMHFNADGGVDLERDYGIATATEDWSLAITFKLNALSDLGWNTILGGYPIGTTVPLGEIKTWKTAYPINVRYYTGAATITLSAAANAVLGVWYRLLFTHSPVTGGKLYINGELEDSDPATAGTYTVGRLHLSSKYNGSDYSYQDVSEVRLYRRCLSTADAWQLYAEPWELHKPLIRRWMGWKSPITVRIPRYGFTNFQVPGIV